MLKRIALPSPMTPDLKTEDIEQMEQWADELLQRIADAMANKLRGLTDSRAQDEMLEPSLADIQAATKIA
jgi:hypothetical protein